MCLKDYSEIIEFFDKKSLHWQFSEKDEKNAAKVVSMLDCSNPDVILDVGCGTGGLYPFLHKKFPKAKIIGLDLCGKMLGKIAFPYDLLIEGNAEHIPIQEMSVDVVLNYCVFPHFIEKIKVIRETFRILKPNGHYYIIHPEGRSMTDHIHKNQECTVKSHLLPQKDEMVTSLSTNGFRIFHEMDEEMFLFAGKKRMEE